MYSLIDQKSAPQLLDKDEAFTLLADAKRDNPDADWAVYGTVNQSTDADAMERLYALCGQLLQVSKINPMKLEMRLTNILEEETTYTAARIMIDARNAMDEVQS